MSIYYSCNLCRITFDLISDIKNNFALKVSFYASIFRLNIIGSTKHSFSQKALIFGALSINEILSEPVDNLTLVSHFPEMLLISVALLAWACSPLGVYSKNTENARRGIIRVMLATVIVAIFLAIYANSTYSVEKGTLYTWYDALISDYFVLLFKFALLVFGLAALILIYLSFNTDARHQYWVFLLLYTLVPGFIAILSANDLLTLFVLVEFISLVAYVLPVLGNPNKMDGIVASTKYYIIGAIASAVLLTGTVLLGTENSSYNFDDIQVNWISGNFSNLEFIGILLILCAFAIKVAVFPAYTWVSAVYSGSSYAVLLIFAIISKLSILGLFVRFYWIFWPWLYQHYSLPLFCLSVITIVGGVIGAFYSYTQHHIKEFIGYTGINQIGYIFMGLCIFDNQAIVNASIYYLILYSIANIVFIGSLFYFSSNGCAITRFDHISLALSKKSPAGVINKYFIILIGLSVWSIAGLPPFGNFFAKISLWGSILSLLQDFCTKESNLFIFNPQFFVELYSPQFPGHFILLWLVILSVGTSIVSLYYYLGIIGFIISPVDALNHEIKPEVSKINLDRSKVWFCILLFFIFILCLWGLFIDDIILVPKFFSRLV